MLAKFRKLFKFLRVATIIGIYATICSLGKHLYRDPRRQRKFLLLCTHYTAGRLLNALGIHLTVENAERFPATGRPGLLISNHLSYTDVLILSSLRPSVFVTSVEVEKAFFLGTMARCAGSLFVERRSKSWLADEVESISQVLRDGFNVVVFPEGTTSCGESVLPFKASLFEAAKNAMVDVVPICLNYREIDRQPVTPVNRDSVFYYGSMEFGDHFNRLLSLTSIQVGLCFLETLPVSPDSSRKELTKTAYQAIQERYFQFTAV